MDVKGWVSEHPSGEFVAAGILVGIHYLIARRYEGGNWLSWIGPNQRVGVYGTAAGVISLLGGLCAIGVSVMLSGEGDRAKAVRRLYGSVLRRTWVGLLAATFVAAMLCVVAQTMDGRHASGPTIGRWFFEYAVVLSMFAFARLIWLLNALMKVADQDLTDVPRQAAPRLGKNWRNREPEPTSSR